MAFLKQKIIVSDVWSSFCESGGQTRTGEGNQLCLPPHAHSEGELSWVEEEGIGVPFVLIKSLSFSFSLLLFFLLPFFLSLPFFYCPRLYMCGVIVLYCWVTNLHTLDDLQQLPSTLFRAGCADRKLRHSIAEFSTRCLQSPKSKCHPSNILLWNLRSSSKVLLHMCFLEEFNLLHFFKRYPIKLQ